MRNIVFISSCALDGAGVPDPFLLQELPWLRRHFDRVLLCSYYGVAELKEDKPTTVAVRRPGFAAQRARVRALFCLDFWRELAHLRSDGKLTASSAAKLYLFTVRGYKLALWTNRLLAGLRDDETTLYAYWMSYDGFAAALCKRRHPRCRAIARGHAFDVDLSRNPMNPYLHKQFMLATLDGAYLISAYAKQRLLETLPRPMGKLHVVGLGSGGETLATRFPSPCSMDGVLRIVSCSAIIEIKQLPLLIDAIALLDDRDVRWTHIGGGADEQAVRRYAGQKLGSRLRVEYELLGNLPNESVQQLYAAQPFDVFVNVSRMEGIPVSIMEAMCFGMPVVAPRVGGIPELVDDSVGFLYDPAGGAQAVADALNAVAELSADRAERMREAAQTRWKERCRNETLLPLLFPAQKGEPDA